MLKKNIWWFLSASIIFSCFIVIRYSKCRLIIQDDALLKIQNGLFQKKDELTSITIPEHIKVIADDVFSGCRSLENIEIPEGVTMIGSAFSGCTSLKSIVLPPNIKKIENYTFSRCENLRNIEISENVTEIGDGAFNENRELKNIELPDSVTYIGEEAFLGCTKLSDIEMSATITQVRKNAFLDTDLLRNMEKDVYGNAYLGSLLVIGQKDLVNLNVREGTTAIASEAFKECNNLERVILPEGILGIGDSAFYACENLEEINFPQSLVSIGYSSFAWCKIRSAKLPNGVTEIRGEAFAGCEELEDVEIPDSITVMGGAVFSGTPWQDNLPADEDGSLYYNGILLDCDNISYIKVKEGTRLVPSIVYRGFMDVVELPESLEYIGVDVFVRKIGNGSLPESLVCIESGSFLGAEIDVENLVLPNGLKSIGGMAFSVAKGFRTVVIPESVEYMGDYAFSDCRDLKVMKVPKHLRGTFTYSGKTKIIYY